MWSHQTPFPILATKLIPPSQRTGLVNRERLLASVAQIVNQRLCLVSAPAGYGKTTMLARAFAALSSQGCHAGWLSLEHDDNDLARLLCYVIEAGKKAQLAFGSATATLLTARAGLPAETLKTSLINELAALKSDFFLFLDDYHLIDSAEVKDFITALLLAPLPHIHLLIGTRSPNALPVGRLRASGQVHELEANDLVFSEEEIAEFFSEVAQARLPSSAVVSIRERTEGWIASLQMIAIAMRGAANVDALLRAFTGEQRSISSFLSDEVFKRQPAEIQEFLLGTSILKRFNCGLCNAVLRRTDSRHLLDRVESANLFIFSLGADRNWYRYHHLFSEYLRKILADQHPEQLIEYHRRACAWLTANDFASEAIEHALACDDLAAAAELLDRSSPTLFASGQTSTLQTHSSRLPVELLSTLPQLQLELAWDYEIQWQFDHARSVLQNVRRSLAQRQRSSSEPSAARDWEFLQTKLAHRELMLAMFTDDYESALQLCHQWQSSNSSDDLFMAASVGTSTMMCNRERYECSGTPQIAEALRKLFVDAAALYGTIFHDTASAETLFMRGEIADAQYIYRRALAHAEEMHGAGSKLACMPAMMLAEAHYECGSTDEAAALLARYRQTSVEFGFVDSAIARFITEARLARTRQDTTAMDSALEAGFHIAAKYGFRRLHAHLLAEKVRYLVEAGNVRDAARLLKADPHRDGCQPSSPSSKATTTAELFTTAYARVWGETDRITEAISLMRKWFAFTRDHHCRRSAVRVGALLAKLCARAGDRPAARRYLLEALKLAEPGGFIRSFVDEGPIVSQLLADLSKSSHDPLSVSPQYVQSILARCQATSDAEEAPAAARPREPGRMEPLSAREIEILRLTAENLENKEIAEHLGLTESTVKWYWKKIFSKLRVHRRFHAVKVARQNGLVA